MQQITMRQFGKWGRAGNQFFQYAFLTGYATQHNAELQLPPWVGNQLFGTTANLTSHKLPVWKEPGGGLTIATPPHGKDLVSHDFQGYAQYHTSYFANNQQRIRALFQPIDSVATRVDPVVSALQSCGKTIIGVHLRRGDYGRRIFPVIPTSWYLKWLQINWKRFEDPTLFIATETPSLVQEFAQYNPQTVETLGISLSDKPMENCTYLKEDLVSHDTRAMDWYPDFHLLSKCDVILGPSSSFSFFAAMLNTNLKEYWRASLATEDFESVDPWNAYPGLRQHVRDYGHLPDIALKHNRPHW